MANDQAGTRPGVLQPQTLIGWWLREGTLGTGKRGQWQEKLDRTRSWDLGGGAPVSAVLHEAFVLMMCRRFPPETDVPYITYWVDHVIKHFKAEQELSVPVGQALVRAALGEPVDVSDISDVEAFAYRVYFFGGAFSELYWDRKKGKDVAALDAMLVEAEHLAAEKGFHPILVTDVPDEVDDA